MKKILIFLVLPLSLVIATIGGYNYVMSNISAEEAQKIEKEIDQKLAIYNETGEWVSGDIEDYKLLNKINSIDEGRSERFMVISDERDSVKVREFEEKQEIIRVFDKINNDLYFIYNDTNIHPRGVGKSSIILHVEENIQFPE